SPKKTDRGTASSSRATRLNRAAERMVLEVTARFPDGNHMKHAGFLMPREDQWVVEHLASAIARRLNEAEDKGKPRTGLFVMLFALQRLPHLSDGTNISISISISSERS